jgi:hypothetical protein
MIKVAGIGLLNAIRLVCSQRKFTALNTGMTNYYKKIYSRILGYGHYYQAMPGGTKLFIFVP